MAPENTTARLLARLDDYERMRIAGICVLDPQRERAYRFTSEDLRLKEETHPLQGSSAVLDWNAISALRD